MIPDLPRHVDAVERRLLAVLAQRGATPPVPCTATAPDIVDLISALTRLRTAIPHLAQLVMSGVPVENDLWREVADLLIAAGTSCRRQSAEHAQRQGPT